MVIRWCRSAVVVVVCVGSDLQEAFEQVDHDRDGVINVEELEQIALSLGLKLTHSQAEAVVSRFGTKGQSSRLTMTL